MATNKKFYGAESQGLYCHWCGEPGEVFRFGTKRERDAWVAKRRELRQAIDPTHLWVKQAHNLCEMDGDDPRGWKSCYVLLVSYDRFPGMKF